MPEFSVYKITNRAGGRCYIGVCSCSVRRRWLRHCAMALRPARGDDRGSPALHAAIRKYGEDGFVVEQLFVAFDWASALAAERVLIRDVGTRSPAGYNLTDGGEGVLGCEFSQAERARRSAAARGRKKSAAILEKLSAALKGQTRSAEQKERLSRARKRLHEERPETLAALHAGLHRWIESGGPAALSEQRRKAATGRRHSAETKRKMGAWQVGRKLSEETKAKISARAKARQVECGS